MDSVFLEHWAPFLSELALVAIFFYPFIVVVNECKNHLNIYIGGNGESATEKGKGV